MNRKVRRGFKLCTIFFTDSEWKQIHRMADVPSPAPLCPTQNKIGKFVEQLTQAKYENKARGESSDLAPLRIGPRYRIRKNSYFSCNLASCRYIQNFHFIFIFKLAEVWLKDGQETEDQEGRMKNKKYKVLKCFHLISNINLKLTLLTCGIMVVKSGRKNLKLWNTKPYIMFTINMYLKKLVILIKFIFFWWVARSLIENSYTLCIFERGRGV